MILELVLVVAVLAVAGLGIYTSMKHKSSTVAAKTTQGPSKPASPTPDPYAGWQSYTLKYEKISLKYPSGWALSDQTANCQNTDSEGQLLYTPGSDCVTITSPDQLAINIMTAQYNIDFGGPRKVLSSTAIKLLGGIHYLNFEAMIPEGGQNSPLINGGFELVNSPTAPGDALSYYPTSKNIIPGPGLQNPSLQFRPAPIDMISIYYSQPTNNHYPLSRYQQDTNYANAIKILESMTY